MVAKYPHTINGPKDDITARDEHTVEIGCREEPLGFWVEDKYEDSEIGPVLVPTKEAWDLAMDAGFSNTDITWYRQVLQRWHDDGFVSFEDDGLPTSGELEGLGTWTTEDDATVEVGDILIEFKDEEAFEKWVRQTNHGKTTPVGGVGRVVFWKEQLNPMSLGDRQDVRDQVTVLIKPNREDTDLESINEVVTSQADDAAKTCGDCGESDCICLPEWVDEDAVYELEDGKVGVPKEYRVPESGVWYISMSHPNSRRQDRAKHLSYPAFSSPRIILEECELR